MGLHLSQTATERAEQAIGFHQEFAEFHRQLGPEADETASEHSQISRSISIALETVQLAIKKQHTQQI